VPVGIACKSKLIVLWPAVTLKSFSTLLFMPLATIRMQLTPVEGTVKSASIRALPCKSEPVPFPQATTAATQAAGTIRIIGGPPLSRHRMAQQIREL